MLLLCAMQQSQTRSTFACFVWLLVLLASACSPTDDGEPGTPLDLDLTWEEDDDAGNEQPGDAEEVDVPWQRSVSISGTMAECGYDGAENWPWTGDNDNYRIEVPELGYIDVRLDWESSSDLDLIIYFQPPGNSANPDWFSNINSNSGPEEYLFDEQLERGDDIIVVVTCAGGAADSYTLVINWET